MIQGRSMEKGRWPAEPGSPKSTNGEPRTTELKAKAIKNMETGLLYSSSNSLSPCRTRSTEYMVSWIPGSRELEPVGA